jgi:uncharacterized protein YdaU (DUF1376 family)
MAQPPAFQCYAKDLYTGTSDLSAAEFGTYWRGICWSWDNGPLPVDAERRRRVLLLDRAEYEAVWPHIEALWTKTRAGWVNARLEGIRALLAKFTASKSAAGHVGAAKRWQKDRQTNSTAIGLPLAEGMASDASAVCSLQSASTKIKSVHRAPRSTPIGFDQFWEIYPRKTAKQSAIKAWNLHCLTVPIATICAAVEAHKRSRQWTKDGGDFIPHPSTWLNQHRWDDELPTPARPRTLGPVYRDEFDAPLEDS